MKNNIPFLLSSNDAVFEVFHDPQKKRLTINFLYTLNFTKPHKEKSLRVRSITLNQMIWQAISGHHGVQMLSEQVEANFNDSIIGGKGKGRE